MTMLLVRILFSLQLHTLHCSWLHMDAVFFISVYSGLNCFLCFLDTTAMRVLPRNFRNLSLFTATCNNSLSARYVPAANLVFKDVYIFGKHITSLKQIQHWYDIFVSTYQCFFRVKGFSLVLLLYCFFPVILFLFCVFRVFFTYVHSFCAVFMLLYWLYYKYWWC